jgi:hypothetical protein
MRTLAALAAVIALSGCYTVRYQTQTPAGARVHEERESFFLWGLVGAADVDLDAICPEGPAVWQNEANFVDGLLTLITFGLYAPRTVTVWCGSTIR